MLVDFNGRVENLLRELRILLQYDGRGQEVGPSKRRLEPDPEPVSRPDAASPPTSTLGAPATGEPSALTLQPEAPQDQPEPAATPVVPDPIHQEPIPDSLNTNDIPSLHQWATESLQDSATSATGSQRLTDPVVRITPGSVTQSQRRGTRSVQTNLFGGTRKDPSARFRQWMRKSQAQWEEQAEEVWSSSKAEEDPVDDREEEEEDPGSSDGYGSGEEEEDEDSPPASAHRLVTQSTPKKSVSRPKRKAIGRRDPGLEVAPEAIKGAEVGAGVGRLVRIEVDLENPGGHVSLL